MGIRQYRDDDFRSILDIYEKSKLDELKFETSSFKLLPLERDSKRFSKLMESEIFVYEKEPIEKAALEKYSIKGYGANCGNEIRALYVSPEERGRGIGRYLLEFLLSRIEGRALLHVARSNAPAKKLYELYGFRVTDEFLTSYNGVDVFANTMVRD